jgi:hypothetical protein
MLLPGNAKAGRGGAAARPLIETLIPLAERPRAHCPEPTSQLRMDLAFLHTLTRRLTWSTRSIRRG